MAQKIVYSLKGLFFSSSPVTMQFVIKNKMEIFFKKIYFRCPSLKKKKSAQSGNCKCAFVVYLDGKACVAA